MPNLTTNEIRTQFALYAVRNDFYAVRNDFFSGYREHMHCCIFFRSEWRSRRPAYCVAIYQFLSSVRYVAVHQSLEAVLSKLKSLNCTSEQWEEIDREQVYAYFASGDSARLWRGDYGIYEDGEFVTTCTKFASIDESAFKHG